MNDSARDEGLERMRAELDQLDKQLLQSVRDRIRICLRIGEYKRENSIPMMQPHRVNLVHERACQFGLENGIDTDFLRQLYDTIIAETCRLEDEVIGKGNQ